MYMDILRDTLRDVDWNRCIFRSIDYDGGIIAGDSVTYTYRFTTKLPLYLVYLLNINRNADSPIIEIHVCLLLINDICWVSVLLLCLFFHTIYEFLPRIVNDIQGVYVRDVNCILNYFTLKLSC